MGHWANLYENLYEATETEALYICSNYDPGLTLTYFMARLKFCNLGFYIGKYGNNGFFGHYCNL